LIDRQSLSQDSLWVDPRFHLLAWCLCVSVMLFGFYVAQDLGYVNWVYSLDRSRVSWVISALVVIGSCHAAWHLRLYSQRLRVAQQLLAKPSSDVLQHVEHNEDDNVDAAARSFAIGWVQEMQLARPADGSRADRAAQDDLLDVYADRLRAPVELGWFLVDVTIRLGLLGTIIGFILIFTSLSGVSIDAAEGLRDLLVAMSGGMGTALLTTLAGLVGASVLSVQYLIAGRAAEHLVGQLVRLRLHVG